MTPPADMKSRARTAPVWLPPGRVVLEARGLVKELGGDVKSRVLHGIDLALREREFLALTGFSGSGKSTLLYLLGALDRPTSGHVFVDGVDVDSLDDQARATVRNAKLGFVFQFHFLLPEFSALENVMLPMLRRGRYRESEIQRRAAMALEQVGLGDKLQRRPHQLSGGQQQRVAIARAIANEPRIILADEPTGSLDSANGNTVIDLLTQLVRQRGVSIVMVTHERSFAARASRQIVLRDGRIERDLDQRGPEYSA